MIKVEIVDSMGDDLMVANVARVSFNRWKDELDGKDVGLIKFLAHHEHTTPFRHPQIQLRCTAPIYIARQLGKHQVGMTWNEISRRYVDSSPSFHYTSDLRIRPEGGIKQGSSTETMPVPSVLNYMDDALNIYESMIETGIAPEVARTFLPQNMETTWIWTGSLYAFFNTWRQRIDGHAQLEAQEFAEQLGNLLHTMFPHSMEALKEAEEFDFKQGQRIVALKVIDMINDDKILEQILIEMEKYV